MSAILNGQRLTIGTLRVSASLLPATDSKSFPTSGIHLSKLLVFGTIILLGVMATYIIGPLHASTRFVVTATLMYKGAAHTAQAVWQLETAREFGLGSSSPQSFFNKIRGEALRFSLPDGTTILALRRFKNDFSSDGLGGFPNECIGDSSDSREYLNIIAKSEFDCYFDRPFLHLIYSPPATNSVPVNFNEVDYNSIYISSLHIKSTDYPITNTIRSMYPWLNNYKPDFDLTLERYRVGIIRHHYYVRDFTTELN